MGIINNNTLYNSFMKLPFVKRFKYDRQLRINYLLLEELKIANETIEVLANVDNKDFDTSLILMN